MKNKKIFVTVLILLSIAFTICFVLSFCATEHLRKHFLCAYPDIIGLLLFAFELNLYDTRSTWNPIRNYFISKRLSKRYRNILIVLFSLFFVSAIVGIIFGF